MNTNLNGFNVKEITLCTEDDIRIGMPVTIGVGRKAVLPGEKKPFMGICTGRKGNYVTVAVSGLLTVTYTGTDLTLGYNLISADGLGGVKMDLSNTVSTFVFDVDTEKKLVTILLK